MPYIEEAGIKFSDLIDLTKSFTSNLGKNKSSGLSTGTLTKSSIMKASKDLVLSFPVLCSNTVTPQTAMMATYSSSKAIEVAKRVWERRGLDFTENDEKILDHIFQNTHHNRKLRF